MEGTQTLTFSSGFILVFIFIYNTINDVDAYEYYYLLGTIFIVSLFISYRYIYEKTIILKKTIAHKIKNNNK